MLSIEYFTHKFAKSTITMSVCGNERERERERERVRERERESTEMIRIEVK
jgi:hypothetical protein